MNNISPFRIEVSRFTLLVPEVDLSEILKSLQRDHIEVSFQSSSEHKPSGERIELQCFKEDLAEEILLKYHNSRGGVRLLPCLETSRIVIVNAFIKDLPSLLCLLRGYFKTRVNIGRFLVSIKVEPPSKVGFPENNFFRCWSELHFNRDKWMITKNIKGDLA